MKKNLYIVSADDIILYQPSILNLYDYLSEWFTVTIITFEPEYLGKEKDNQRNIIYIKSGKLQKKAFRYIDLLSNAILKRANKIFPFFSFRSRTQRLYKEHLLLKCIRPFAQNLLIAVDPMPLYVTQQITEKCCFLSLEIIPNDPYLKKMNPDKLACVVIQNQKRYNYLFPNATPKVFYIQNAPMLKNKIVNTGQRNNLLWAGTITKEFGVLNCTDFIKENPSYKLVLKGASANNTKELIETTYPDLIKSGNIEINNKYLEANEFISFISTFRIGFCFYNWELIRTNINYETAPSGKLFMYLAAGVPVIACNISGFSFINDFNAGVLIDDYNSATILAAIKKIEADYANYSANAYTAFENTCFDKNAGDFKNFLLGI